ncbi:MAG: hypothetical protein ACFFCS_27955 [Candidatus Hodarchaeota archaeon]
MSDAENENADDAKDEEVVDEPEPEPAEKKKEPKKKKEKKPKAEGEKSDKLKEVEEQFTKWGYVDFWDYLTFIAGAYGLVYSIINFIQWPYGTNLTSLIVGTVTYSIILLIYAIVMLFPFVAKLIVKKLQPKAPGLFPFAALKTQEDYRQFIAVIGCISALLLTMLEPNVGNAVTVGPAVINLSWIPRLAHLPVMFVLWIVIYAESFRKKIPKLPPNKPVVD